MKQDGFWARWLVRRFPAGTQPDSPGRARTLARGSPALGRMHDLRRRIVWIALAGVAAAGCGRQAEDERSLHWAADAEGGAPYIFKDDDNPNVNVGFEVDLAQALAAELGRRIEFQQYEYKSLLLGLQRGDFDLAMNGLEVTPDRLKHVRFSRPYYVYQLQLVVRADDDRFRSLEDCKAKGAVVGTLEETAAEKLLDRMGIRKKIYDGQVEPYFDLELGRLDAVLLDLPIAAYYAAPNDKLQLVGEPLAAGHYAIAFRKDQEELARQFDAALEKLAEDGSLQRIYQRWGIWNDEQAATFAPAPEATLTGPSPSWRPADYLPLLLRGAWITIEISVLSMALAVALGLPIAVARLSGPKWLALGATIYVEFFRGIPMLLLLYFLYFGLGHTLRLPAFWAAVIGFGLNYAAYEAEIYRAGIGAISLGQWEAAASLGMSRGLTFRRIILPQAIRVILPPMTNDFIALFKDTSLVSAIAVVELTKQYLILTKSSQKFLEIGLITAALYLVMSVPLGCLSRRLEQRWGKGL